MDRKTDSRQLRAESRNEQSRVSYRDGVENEGGFRFFYLLNVYCALRRREREMRAPMKS